MHKHERGMSFWPFVITLILLLVFVFMWFSAKSDKEDALVAKAKAEDAATLTTDKFTQITDYLDKLGKVVGWQDVKTPIEVKDSKGAVVYKYDRAVPNVGEIEKALSTEPPGSP